MISKISAWNLKSFSLSLEHFFLTVGQKNLGNKIPFFGLREIIFNQMVYSSFFFRIGLYFVRIPFLAIFDTFLAVFKHCFIFVSFCHFGYFLVIFRWSWLAVPYPWLCPGCISGGDCNLATILAIFDTFWPFFKNSYIFGFFFHFGNFLDIFFTWSWLAVPYPWLCPGCISDGDWNLATILAICDAFWPFYRIVIYLALFAIFAILATFWTFLPDHG